MGFVYYAHYLAYFEVARTEMIRSTGYPYRKLEDQGVMLPVVEAQVQYKAPLFYDDEIEIKVHLYDMPSVKLETYYEMVTPRREAPHARGKVILCFMNEQNRKPCRAPQPFLNSLAKKIKT